MFHCLQGEPGSPVNYKNPDGTWTVIAIVSYDQFNSCQNGPLTPRAFTRVSSYLDWILLIINDGNVTCPSTTESVTTKTSPITTQSDTFSTQLTKTSTITPPCTSSQLAFTQPGNHIAFKISYLSKIICWIHLHTISTV